MAYDEKNGKWRGVVKDTKTGKRVTKSCSTKREAVEWEKKGRAERDRLNATESFQGQRNNYGSSLFQVGRGLEPLTASG